jgi:hypothetical protein
MCRDRLFTWARFSLLGAVVADTWQAIICTSGPLFARRRRTRSYLPAAVERQWRMTGEETTTATAQITRSKRAPGVVLACAAALCLLVSTRSVGARAADMADSALLYPAGDAALYQYANCRLGLTVAREQHAEFSIVPRLNAGSYLDFGSGLPAPGPVAAEYFPMLRLHQGGAADRTCEFDGTFSISPPLDAGFGAIVEANPGMLWIVGNEPDRVGQDNICPQQYAQAYHDVYAFIKEHDPSAQVAVAGLVQVTPMRIDYLDIVWDSYLARYGEPMPVDVWSMHIYVLSEQDDGDAHLAVGADRSLRVRFATDGNCANTATVCHAEHDDVGLFQAQVVRMRQWMKDHGQQDRPLILTEFGILKPYHYYGQCSVEKCPAGDVDGCFCDETKRTFHPLRVEAFLTSTLDYLLNETDPNLGYPADNDRLVQQSLWFRLATLSVDGLGHASNLADPDDEWTLTVVGQGWQDYVQAIMPTVNLRATAVPTTTGHLLPGGDASVTLLAHVINNGDLVISDEVTVTFYADEALTVPLGSTTITNIPGCARRELSVALQAVWPGAGIGAHDYWFQLDAGGALSETDETDNVGEGIAYIFGHATFLPLAFRGP